MDTKYNHHKGIGILGGSFNPVHMGHLRSALEIFEAFELQYIDLVPCANPPHKDINGLLPFDMRVDMLKNAIASIDYLRINTNESQRKGPSYTYDTLLEYKTKLSCQELFFIMGEKDFLTIPTWHKGLSLPKLANIIIIAQAKHNYVNFKVNVFKFWAQATCGFKNNIPIFSLEETNIFYVNLPHLDISSSMIREHWMHGENIKYLTPDNVIDLLNANKKTAQQYWTEI